MRVQLTALGPRARLLASSSGSSGSSRSWTSSNTPPLAEENRVWKKAPQVRPRRDLRARRRSPRRQPRQRRHRPHARGNACKEGPRVRLPICSQQLLGDRRRRHSSRRLRRRRASPSSRSLVKADISKAERTRVEEYSHALPGVSPPWCIPQRRYHYGATAGHILGYLGQINQRELEAMKAGDGYTLGDLYRARRRREACYEDPCSTGRTATPSSPSSPRGRPQLRTDRRGIPRIAPRDTSGNFLGGEESREEPSSGEPLRLALDMGLQAKCEDLLRGKHRQHRGAQRRQRRGPRPRQSAQLRSLRIRRRWQFRRAHPVAHRPQALAHGLQRLPRTVPARLRVQECSSPPPRSRRASSTSTPPTTAPAALKSTASRPRLALPQAFRPWLRQR
jgi:hypothetical protein